MIMGCNLIMNVYSNSVYEAMVILKFGTYN